MAQVQIMCPRSGLWASIGMEVEPDQWEDLEPTTDPAKCGVCGELHTWSKPEARLVEWRAPDPTT